MKIETKNLHQMVELSTRECGDIFTIPDCREAFYIVIEPDFGLKEERGVYCVNLKSGTLYCFDEVIDVIPVNFSAVASF